MGLADFLFFHQVEWDTLASFVVRNAVHETVPKSPDKKLYHRVFVIVWLWAVLVLTPSYAGNNSRIHDKYTHKHFMKNILNKISTNQAT